MQLPCKLAKKLYSRPGKVIVSNINEDLSTYNNAEADL